MTKSKGEGDVATEDVLTQTVQICVESAVICKIPLVGVLGFVGLY
jgi:hypothetical protein